MKITEVEVGRTINTGNYESTKVSLRAEVNCNETPEKVIGELEMQLLKLEKKVKKTGVLS